MTSDQFWSLTWFEWSIHLLAIEQRQEMEVQKFEHDWQIARILWATLCNIHRNPKKKPLPFEPQDLIKLSFDKEKEKDEEFKPMSSKEMKELFGSNFKHNG